MALNDWADRERTPSSAPHRPLPSGRIAPAAALAAAGALTAAGLGWLAAAGGRPALLAATALAATVWAYDLRLKHTPGGPAAMAAARALDLCSARRRPGGRAGTRPSAGHLRTRRRGTAEHTPRTSTPCCRDARRAHLRG